MKTAIAVAALAFTACAAVPKPQELLALEQSRRESLYAAAQKRAPELVAESDKYFAQSRKEWESKDLDESRRDALMGSIKLNTAYAMVEQDQARARVQAAQAESAKAQEEYNRLAKDLAALNEQIALLQKLAGVSSQLGQEQARAKAFEGVKAAELSLKNAEAVNASRHAPAEYQAAADLLERARAEMKAGSLAAATATAEQARVKADEATGLARPTHEKGEQNLAEKARSEALTRDATALGLTVKVDRQAQSQRLRVVIPGLFAGRSTVLMPAKDPLLDDLASLLKKYPSYLVQVVGHTDSRGKHDELVALSMARAQSVFAALVMRGVDPKRASVTGQGPDDPVVPGKSAIARTQNNRVELVFLY